jgi:hypothetical protein
MEALGRMQAIILQRSRVHVHEDNCCTGLGVPSSYDSAPIVNRETVRTLVMDFAPR